MRIIDLIEKLQTLYNTYDDEYKAIAGEPEIVIDVFEKVDDNGWFKYAGYDHEIVLEKTDCGTYDILNTFRRNVDEPPKPVELEPWPFPLNVP